MLVFLLILIIIPIQLINTQQQCNNYKHLFVSIKKMDIVDGRWLRDREREKERGDGRHEIKLKIK